MTIDEDAVWARLTSAELRADELSKLTPSDPAEDRHRLAQEFFFHLGGAIEFMAQLAAERRSLGDPDKVTMKKSAELLAKKSPSDPLEKPLCDLYINLGKVKFPSDPYAGDGLLWRIYNYRHQVTHRGANPFRIEVGKAPVPSIHFRLNPLDYLDPRHPDRGVSKRTIADDMASMLDLVRTRITAAMNAL